MRELTRALKAGEVIEVEADLYLLDDGREVFYNRYRRGAYKWECEGYAYRNFFEVLHKEEYFRKAI